MTFGPEGTDIEFEWSVNPNLGVTINSDGTNAVASFSQAGSYEVKVEVTDQAGSVSNEIREVVVYGNGGFSSFKGSYLDSFWDLQNIDVDDNTPEQAVYNLETLEGQLQIRIPGDKDFPLGLPNVNLPPSKNYVKLDDQWKYNDKNQ